MDPDTFRGDVGVEGGDVYWRRRVSVLTGMLVVVAVVAWACASGTDKPTTATKAGSGGTDAMVVSLPSPKFSAPAPSPTPFGSPSPGSSPASGSPKPAPARRNGDPCEGKDLVISLRANQETYRGAEDPGFLLTVVNIGDVACVADLGPRTLEMRISTGGERVWSTADCVAGEGIDRQLLHRGVPFVRTILWPRTRSVLDCAAKAPSAHKGTYVALARIGSLKSSRNVFHLK
ncbi:hypothetical protein [Acrocarpospora phusangensis]|nr:hypothetical protein [Acrocarpospora phusangensis]